MQHHPCPVNGAACDFCDGENNDVDDIVLVDGDHSPSPPLDRSRRSSEIAWGSATAARSSASRSMITSDEVFAATVGRVLGLRSTAARLNVLADARESRRCMKCSDSTGAAASTFCNVNGMRK